MQSKNNVTKEQWMLCDRCGQQFPMSMLTKQKGMLLDQKCIDDLTIERRQFTIEQILGTNITEGVDLRAVDRGFFEGFDETNR